MTKKKTIVDVFEHSTSAYADNTFLMEKVGREWTHTTYKQVQQMVYHLGAGLQQIGVSKGDCMALLSEGRNLWIVSELAMFYAGAINVPLSIKLEESNDLLFRMKHGDVKYIIVSGTQLKKVRAIRQELTAVQRVIVLDKQTTWEEGEIGVDEVMEMGRKYLQEHTLEEFRSVGLSLQNDDIATITYTSGTTADLKRPITEQPLELEHYLLKNEKQNKSYVRPAGTPGAKQARLDVRRIGQSDRYTLVEVHLHTGRHHQIRCQLSASLAPIKGDLKYGDRRSNPDASICLHAREITFTHPVSQNPIHITAPYPSLPLWQKFQ